MVRLNSATRDNRALQRSGKMAGASVSRASPFAGISDAFGVGVEQGHAAFISRAHKVRITLCLIC